MRTGSSPHPYPQVPHTAMRSWQSHSRAPVLNPSSRTWPAIPGAVSECKMHPSARATAFPSRFYPVCTMHLSNGENVVPAGISPNLKLLAEMKLTRKVDVYPGYGQWQLTLQQFPENSRRPPPHQTPSSETPAPEGGPIPPQASTHTTKLPQEQCLVRHYMSSNFSWRIEC